MPKEIKETKTTKKKTTTKKVVSKDISPVKKVTKEKKEATKKSTSKQDKVTKTSSTLKKDVTTKKVKTIKEDKKNIDKKDLKTSKVTKSTTKKKVAAKTTKKTKATKKPVITISEYYDLPYSYNKTVVKLLAQTPNKLFVYWEISDDDRNKFIEEFGDDFFNNSYPVLVIKNTTMDYAYEVRIDDFANSWYLNINDANCKYEIDFGRRPIHKNEAVSFDYIHITSSNTIEAPNDDVLIKDVPKSICFKNTKTNITLAYDLSNDVYENAQKIASIYKFYLSNNSKLNGNKIFDFSNPSSK